MVHIVNFDSWNVETYSTSGRSEKVWLSEQDKIGLFKFRKSEVTTEHVSEKIAQMLAERVGLPCAKIDIGKYNDKIGSFSYLINSKSDNEDLTEGISFISGLFPNYDVETLCCGDTGEYYSIEMVMKSFDSIVRYVPKQQQEYAEKLVIPRFKKQFLRILIFDALIGNTDRHQSNWAILSAQGQERTYLKDISPIYDNGSSLCAYVTEDIINHCRRDKNRMRATVDSKSKSIIRIDGKNKTKPTHRQVLEHIKSVYEPIFGTFDIVEEIRNKLSVPVFIEIVNEFPDNLLTQNKKDFLVTYLTQKQTIICDVFGRGGL